MNGAESMKRHQKILLGNTPNMNSNMKPTIASSMKLLLSDVYHWKGKQSILNKAAFIGAAKSVLTHIKERLFPSSTIIVDRKNMNESGVVYLKHNDLRIAISADHDGILFGNVKRPRKFEYGAIKAILDLEPESLDDCWISQLKGLS